MEQKSKARKNMSARSRDCGPEKWKALPEMMVRGCPRTQVVYPRAAVAPGRVSTRKLELIEADK